MKILLHVSFLSGVNYVQYVCALMVIILHIKTFETFDFGSPLLQDVLLTPIWIKSNDFLDIIRWMIGLQNCKDEIAENFVSAPKKEKKPTVCVSFLSGIALLEIVISSTSNNSVMITNY